MAVIRQKTQTFNKPIGVVRASQGGRAVGEAISSFANEVTQEAYRVAANQAEKRGEKEAMSRSSSDVVNIDPETGKPIAYTAPSSYGSIATEAYQDLIDRRFQDSVLSEIQAKGSELASSSANADQYRQRMSDYVGAMYESAVKEDGELNFYGRVLQETGQQYVASTYATLKKKEITAQRAAIRRANQIASYEQISFAGDLIAKGGDPEQIRIILANERLRNQSLFDSPNGISVSEYIKSNEKLDGLESMMDSNRLMTTFSTLSEGEQAKLKLAVRNPSLSIETAQELGIPDLPVMIASASASQSAGSIISALDSIAQLDTDIEKVAVEDAVGDLEIQPGTSLNDLITSVSSIADVDVRQGAMAEALPTFLVKKLDALDLSSDDMDKISIELQSSRPDLIELQGVLGDEQGLEVYRAMIEMEEDSRSSLATRFMDVRPERARGEELRNTSATSAFSQQIRDLEQSNDLAGDSMALLSRISMSGLSNTDTLLGKANSMISSVASVKQRDIPVSAEAYGKIEMAVVSGLPFTAESDDEQKLFDLLSVSYKASDSVTRGFMAARLNALNEDAADQVKRTFSSSVETAIQSGLSVLPDDLKAYDNSIFDGQAVTISQAINNPKANAAFQKGIILPTVAKAMKSALTSNNQEEIEGAFAFFEQASNSFGTLDDGTTVPIDAMRSALSEDAYAQYSSILLASRQYGKSPVEILALERTYDGNLTADLKSDLELPKSGTIYAALDGFPMSNSYKKQVIASLRYAKLNGRRITQDVVSEIVDDISEGAIVDTQVVGPYIGDSTVYARLNYVSRGDILNNVDQLADLISESGDFSELMRGGTAFDAGVEGLRDLVGLNVLTRSRAVAQVFTSSMEAQTRLQRRDRIYAGLQAIGVELKYRPVISSFNEGIPRWDVGYDDGSGFTPITINDEIWSLTALPASSDSKSEARHTARRMLDFGHRAGVSDEKIVELDIEYLATLDHVTAESFESSPDYMKYKRELDGVDPLDIFNEAREKYEALQ